ncbi:MAG: alpha/beta hydrolase [Gemmatimonadales bacterium]|nr:alpha/beta hydrolase [Gemmatimonadales bacterium]
MRIGVSVASVHGLVVSASLALAPARLTGQVALNHIYVYLDSSSYQAIAASPFVRDSFATMREATVSDAKGSWRGLYLFGQETYLELYRAGPNTPPPGTVAFAFGVDRAGELDEVAARLRGAGRPGVRVTRRRAIGSDTIPWFHQLSPAELDSAAIAPSVRWWVMEYDGAYLARRPPGDLTLNGRTDRAGYNRQLYRPDLAVRDIAGLVLRLPEPVRRALAEQLTTLGFTRQAGSEPLRFVAGAFAIELHSTTGEAGELTEVRFTTTRDQAPSRRLFGSAELTVDGDRSTLRIARQSEAGPFAGCPLASRRVMVGKRQVATCTGGVSGPLVVFESGLGDGISVWSRVLGQVSNVTRVMAYDRAGIGGSAPAGGPRDGRRVAAELAELLDALGEDRPVILVGHSLGGLFVRAFREVWPRRVSGMVLVDPTPEGFFARQRELVGADLFAANRAATMARLQGTALEEWTAIPESEAAVGGRDDSPRMRGSLLSAGKIQSPDPVVGPKAKAIWLDLHRTMAARLGLSHQVVEGAGHYLQLEVPDRIAEEVRRLVEEDAKAEGRKRLHLSGGPAYRFLDRTPGADGRGGWEGLTVNVGWEYPLSTKVGLILGIGGYWGGSAVTLEAIPDDDCPLQMPCAPPNPSPDRGVSGSVLHARIGLAIGNRRLGGGLGAIVGHAKGALDPAGAGAFAEFRFQPMARFSGLTLGLLGYAMWPAPGHTEAVVSPTIGVRF